MSDDQSQTLQDVTGIQPGIFGVSNSSLFRALEVVFAKLVAVEAQNSRLFREVGDARAESVANHKLLHQRLNYLTLQHTIPEALSIVTTKEIHMSNDVLPFKVILPAEPANTDIVGGRLDISINGSPLPTIETAKGQTEVLGLEGPQDAELVLSFCYIDDATVPNKSGSVTNTIKLEDNVAPPTPGQLGVTVVGEVVGGADDTGSEPV